MWTQSSNTFPINSSSIAQCWPVYPQSGMFWNPAQADCSTSSYTSNLKAFPASEISTTVSSSARNSNCEIFVGGIPTSAPEQEVEQVFGRFGKILACRLMRRPDGTSRGFAFITYAISESADYAVSCKNKVKIRGKLVEIRPGLNIHDSRKYRAQLQHRKIYIGNLPPNVSEAEVRELFALFGGITEIKLVREPAQANSPIYGFVTFEDAETVNQVLNLPSRLHLKGRKIQCKLTIPKEHPDGNEDDSHERSSQNPSVQIMKLPQAPHSYIEPSLHQGIECQLFSGQSKETTTMKTSLGSGELSKASADKNARINKWSEIFKCAPACEDPTNYVLKQSNGSLPSRYFEY